MSLGSWYRKSDRSLRRARCRRCAIYRYGNFGIPAVLRIREAAWPSLVGYRERRHCNRVGSRDESHGGSSP